ncbi:MAG: hypothetical protein S4CHLAM45_07550 [Chlamydiales bacterium]|nr:hypothetical protein [Chlamydiales bacterium]MCH9620035.1 hypothetical protein [Chlamydiales bacterium]MCH9622862.1 hypothetical protein [Chlamydiales bacterium]
MPLKFSLVTNPQLLPNNSFGFFSDKGNLQCWINKGGEKMFIQAQASHQVAKNSLPLGEYVLGFKMIKRECVITFSREFDSGKFFCRSCTYFAYTRIIFCPELRTKLNRIVTTMVNAELFN